MGLLPVRLAVAAGARVAGAARGERKLELLRSLGAEPVDYSEDDWPERTLEALGGHPDLVLDGAGGPIGLTAFGLVADGGRFSAHGVPAGGFAKTDPTEAARRGIEVSGIGQVQLSPERARTLVAQAFKSATDGVLKPFIGQTFPLKDASAAHLAVETRNAVGKTLLLP